MSPKNPSPFVVDLETLLAPISADRPSGDSLRYSTLFDQIQQLRIEDDTSLPMGVWQKPARKADWPAMALLCLDALENRTKDLQIAAWLTEAWIELGGLHGLQRGLKLIAALAESFWPDLHPQPQDGDVAFRLAPLLWLDGQLPQRLKRQNVTAPQSSEAAPYDWIAFESSQYLNRLSKTDAQAAEKAIQRGGVPEAKFFLSISLTPVEFYLSLEKELGAAKQALAELRGVLAGLAGAEAPSFATLANQLEDMTRLVGGVVNQRREAGELPAAPDPSIAADQPGAAEEAPRSPAEAVHAGRIRSRADAFRILAEAAEYLLRTEPHSPVPYLVKRAIGWGNLTLAELFRELLTEHGDLKSINKLLGIKESRD